MQKECKFHLTWLLAFIINTVIAQNPVTFDKYHNTGEVRQIIENIHQANPGITKLHTIAVSPGGEPVMVLEISNSKETCPAVFTGANFEGNYPVATEGALMLIKMLLDSSQYLSGLKWYIMPMPNPDAAKGFFSKVKYNRTVNDFPINNDVDENIDEEEYELYRCANREAIPQYFKSKPGVEGQYYLGRNEQSNKDFLAIVLDYDGNEIKLEQRNYFKVGDIVTIFGPKTKRFDLKIEYIKEDETFIDMANHPLQVIKIKCDKKVYKNDIMRVKF